ncbi:hypothetical protein MRX96_009730 [Rhipicephalus microplus]
MTRTQPCSVIPRQLQIIIAIGVGLGVLLFDLLVYFWKKNRRLEYKYMKLVQSSSGKDGELPAAESCAIEEDEEDHFENGGYDAKNKKGLLQKCPDLLMHHHSLRGTRHDTTLWNKLRQAKALNSPGPRDTHRTVRVDGGALGEPIQADTERGGSRDTRRPPVRPTAEPRSPLPLAITPTLAPPDPACQDERCAEQKWEEIREDGSAGCVACL